MAQTEVASRLEHMRCFSSAFPGLYEHGTIVPRVSEEPLQYPNRFALMKQCLVPKTGELARAFAKDEAGITRIFDSELSMLKPLMHADPKAALETDTAKRWVNHRVNAAYADMYTLEWKSHHPIRPPENSQGYIIVDLSRWGGSYLDGYINEPGEKSDIYNPTFTFAQEHMNINSLAKIAVVMGSGEEVSGLLASEYESYDRINYIRNRIKQSGMEIIYMGLDREVLDFQGVAQQKDTYLSQDMITWSTKGKNTVEQLHELKTMLLTRDHASHILLLTNPAHGTRILRMIDRLHVVPSHMGLDVALGAVPRHQEYIDSVWAGEIRALVHYIALGQASEKMPRFTFRGNVDVLGV